MKYMIMAFGDRASLEGRSPEWITKMIEFMIQIDKNLAETGELVFEQGLADPPTATTVGVTNGNRVTVDGPYLESKTSLAGFWIVDVTSEQRALEIATQIAEASEGTVEVRACMDAPPEQS